jgi:hypothetical protein
MILKTKQFFDSVIPTTSISNQGQRIETLFANLFGISL